MNIFYAQFSTGQVVEATGVPNATLQNWIKRGVITAQRSDDEKVEARITGGGKPGIHRRFSFFNVMEIAIAKALLDAGMSNLEQVFHAARQFSHLGGEGLHELQPDRQPGFPFKTNIGTTILAVRGEQYVECLWKPGSDPLPFIWSNIGQRDGFVLIDAEKVFNSVVARLGYHPEELMAQAYDHTGGR